MNVDPCGSLCSQEAIFRLAPCLWRYEVWDGISLLLHLQINPNIPSHSHIPNLPSDYPCSLNRRNMKSSCIVFYFSAASTAGLHVPYLPSAFISSSPSRPLSALNLDSSQASVASGPDAGVKDDLLLVGLMGAWSPAVPYRAVWLPVIFSWHPATVTLIWLLHASKAYYTLKIFLNFYIAWISNDRRVQMGILWWTALSLSSNLTACMDLTNYFYFYHSSKHFWVILGTTKL